MRRNMTITRNHYIAGWKTPTDWQALKVRLLANSPKVWREAFTDFYKERLSLRYLRPIKVLQDNDTLQGEGFSIIAIQCSLIEFLESTEQGINYRHAQRGTTLSFYEYSTSQEIFVAFLKRRAPFSSTFIQEETALDFYRSVRCGVLHEARTKNGWRILARDSAGLVADVGKRIVYRDNFQKALLTYINNYGERLSHEAALQEAFIRKFDNLCE